MSRLEVVDTGRRRRWRLEEKVRVVEESLSGQRQASSTARRYGIANSLLFKWRKAYREGLLVDGPALCGAGPKGFVPALVVADHGGAPRASGGGRMEIVAHGGRRIIVDAGVDAAALSRVLGVLEGRPVPSGVRVWLATGATDMRRGMNTLNLQVQEAMGRDPHAGDLYVFRGRRGDLIKVHWHDGLGISLYAKRLERGRFIWPTPAGGAVPISSAQLGYLLEGIRLAEPGLRLASRSCRMIAEKRPGRTKRT